MRIKLTLLLLVFSAPGLFGQTLKGTIKDSHGEPIPYATVFIKEISQGTTANTMGDYEIKLPDGKYTVIFESLGFDPDIRNISLAKNIIVLNIILREQVYEIPEVRITASGEDPAYGIMRKVIGIAPYYLNQVESYKAEVYLKGNLLLKRIPKIIQRRMKVEARNSQGGSVSSNTVKEGETYLMESFNEIEFTAPDRYKQHVISSQSTFPAEGNEISPMDFIRASFYEPVLNNMFISPLSPEAFFHYKFRYDGVSSQGNYFIDKIEVTPKRKSQQLFKGTIYIIEDLWCLHSVDLINENLAGDIRIQQLFVPVEENLWMPVSNKFDVNISIIGVKGEAGYGSSVKYKEVNINRNLKKPEGLQESVARPSSILNPKDTLKNKTSEQIEQILSKKELSNRDMVKLSNLMDKQSKSALPDSVKNNLEIKERTTFVIEKDANRKDSTFWAGIRPIPLSASEKKSIRTTDSLKASLVTVTTGKDSVKKNTPSKKNTLRTLGGVTFGRLWSDTTGLSFYTSGLLNLRNLNFNTVDGLVYGMDFRLNKTFHKNYTVGLYPAILYAFSREALMWKLNGQFGPANGAGNQFYFSTGKASRDLNNNGGISPLMNSVTTLFLESNYLKLYSSGYFRMGYRREIIPGLRLNADAGYENRRILYNTTDFTFIKTSKTYTPNYPVNEYLTNLTDAYYNLRDHKHGDFTLTLKYTPRERYMMKGKTRIPRGSDWPTFSLSWKHGINDFEGMSPSLKQFDYLKLEVSQRKSIGAFSDFMWLYRAGTFLKDKGFSFIDFTHFNSQYFPVMVKSYDDAFFLKPFYSLSTPEMFSELHVKYTTPYLLIKLLPGISKTLMRENLSFSNLLVKNRPAYTEIGYSISEILLMGELGVYAGFNNFRYNSVGLRLIFRLN